MNDKRLTDEQVVKLRDAFRQWVFGGDEVADALDELLAARARIAELEAETARLPVRPVRVRNGAIVGRLFGGDNS